MIGLIVCVNMVLLRGKTFTQFWVKPPNKKDVEYVNGVKYCYYAIIEEENNLGGD